MALLPPLPYATSRLIGRSRDLAQLGRVAGIHDCSRSPSRRRWQNGPGAALARGRTRTTKETAFFLDLSLLTAPDHIPEAHALSAEIGDGRWPLVVDNCEHLVDAAARLVRTLLECRPALTVLTTSRERLGIVGEVVWSVPPRLVEEAVALFTERARERRIWHLSPRGRKLHMKHVPAPDPPLFSSACGRTWTTWAPP